MFEDPAQETWCKPHLQQTRSTACMSEPAEAPTQTIERAEKALATLQNIERFPCDQHDHVSFAKAWMLMSKGSRACPGL